MNIEPDIFDYLETTSLEPHDDYTSEFTYAEQKQIWNRIKEQKRQINQLTNNWNELRQHIKEYLEEWGNSDDEWVKGKCDMARDILYDMEEIKEGNNVSDRD